MKDDSHIFIPDYITNKSAVQWRDFPLLEKKSEEDPLLKSFLESMPGNYFAMFSPTEVIEHYHFIRRNSKNGFGDIPREISIRTKNLDYILLICNRGLESLIYLLNDIWTGGRRIVHHHSYIPTAGNFQIVFVQTTDEHIHPAIRDDIDLEKVLSTKVSLKEKFLERSVLNVPKKESMEMKFSDLISKGFLGDPETVMKKLHNNFFRHLNIGFRRGVDNAKIAVMSIVYLQMMQKGIDSLCYIQKSHSGLYRITCFAKSPGFMKAQKYLLFLTERLHYYQSLGEMPGAAGFKYCGGYSTFINCSPREQVEASVFYISADNVGECSGLDSLRIDLENELSMDLAYKVVPRFNDLSLFDVLGPIMVGPSSSHTAGANRLGRLAANIINAALESGRISGNLSIAAHLHGSFASTGTGHGTPNAALGGLMGFGESDDRISGEETNPLKVKEFGIEGTLFEWRGYREGSYLGSSYHQNSILFMVNDTDDFSCYPGVLLYIVGESYGGGNVQVREIGGRALVEPISFDTVRRDRFTGKACELLPDIFGEIPIKPIFDYPPAGGKDIDPSIRRPRIAEMDDITWYCTRTKKSLPEIALMYEMATQKIGDRAVVIQQLETTRAAIFDIVKAGIGEREASLEFSGGNGHILNRFATRRSHIGEKLYLKAAAYAIAVAEQNAAHRKIVAAPTAGSCGILPGVLVALTEAEDYSPQEIYDSLLVGAFIGLIISNTVPTAGATHGCQAETGVGCAMAAAMAAFLFDGNTEEIVNAAVLALKNSLGLVCDPIAGKVEVPCIKRNGFKAVEALVAARMSLAGIVSAVPPSEVVRAMDEIGRNLSYIYRETSAGGLARTIRGRDEPRCNRHCHVCFR